MFNDLGYYIEVEQWVLNILHEVVTMSKWSKICRLYVLDGFTIFWHASPVSEDFHDKNKL